MGGMGPMSDNDAFGEVVFSFGRSQALAEGWLVDVTDIAREAGISHPVAVSRRVWDELIVPDELSHRAGQEEMGRLRDVISLLRLALLRGSARTEVRYPVA